MFKYFDGSTLAHLKNERIFSNPKGLVGLDNFLIKGMAGGTP
jgi:hypothetical protein